MKEVGRSAPRGKRNKGNIVLQIVAGACLGAASAGFVAGILSVVTVRTAEAEAGAGWTLIPSLVSLEDVPAGEVVKFDALAERLIPAPLVTTSIVPPARATQVIGLTLLAPMGKGDPLRWNYVIPPRESHLRETRAHDECIRALKFRATGSVPDESIGTIRERIVGEALR